MQTVGDLVQHLLQFDMAMPVRIVNPSLEEDVGGRLDPIEAVEICDAVDAEGEPTGRFVTIAT